MSHQFLFFVISLSLINGHKHMDTHSHELNDTFPEFNQDKIILRWGKVKYINDEYIDYYVTHDGLWHADDCAIIGNEKNGLAIRAQMIRRLNPVTHSFGDWLKDGEYIVPYTPDVNFTDFDAAEFEKAADEYKNKTGIIWRPKLADDEHWVVVIKGSGCWSYTGDVRNAVSPQELSLGPGCQNFDKIVHQMGHTVGMWHTQYRSDRDEWIVIHTENIQQGSERYFEKREDVPLCAGYDCSSTMHLNPYAFSKNLEATITPIDPNICDITRDGLSIQDVICLNTLYPNSSATISPTFSQSMLPTTLPTTFPTAFPTALPTEVPTIMPTKSPALPNKTEFPSTDINSNSVNISITRTAILVIISSVLGCICCITLLIFLYILSKKMHSKKIQKQISIDNNNNNNDTSNNGNINQKIIIKEMKQYNITLVPATKNIPAFENEYNTDHEIDINHDKTNKRESIQSIQIEGSSTKTNIKSRN